MAEEMKKFYPESWSVIVTKGNSLVVMNRQLTDKSIRAIKVCKGFYIELGRPIEQFKNVLMQTRIPIMFQKVISVGTMTHYNIIRMQTGSVKEVILGSIACDKGIITAVLCNRSILTKTDYTTYERASSLWLVSVPCEPGNSPESLGRMHSKLILTVKIIMGIPDVADVKYETEDTKNKINIHVKGEAKGAKLYHTFEFIHNLEKNKYELSLVRLI